MALFCPFCGEKQKTEDGKFCIFCGELMNLPTTKVKTTDLNRFQDQSSVVSDTVVKPRTNQSDYISSNLLIFWPFIGAFLFFGGLLGGFLFAIISSILIYMDAKNLGLGSDSGTKAFETFTWKPLDWGLLTLFFLIVGYPLYLLKRRSLYETKNNLQRTETSGLKIVGGIIGVIIIISIIVAGAAFSALILSPGLNSHQSSQYYSTTSTPINSYSSSSAYSSTTSASSSGVTVRVIYSKHWQGAVGNEGGVSSVDGTGSKDIEVPGSSYIVSANAQKLDGSNDPLTIQIIQNGKIIKQGATSTPYGLAQISTTV